MEPKSPAANISDSNRIGVDLWITDAKLALTLLDLAETTSNAENRFRRTGEAHHAYQSILYFLARLNPTAEQSRMVGELLGTLQRRLKAAGVLMD